MTSALMKKLVAVLSVVLLSLYSHSGFAGDNVDWCHYSTEGTEFWFGFLQNRSTGAEHYVQITVTSQLGANIKLTYGPDETSIGDFLLAPNVPQTIPINYSALEPSLSENIENKGIHLVSDNPVNVYALNYRTQSSDVAVIYPVKSIGSEYYAMCYSPKSTNSETKSEFLIAATASNTTVKIVPSVDCETNKANSTITVTLNKGQVYQVRSMNDLTGSYISANQPIAFFSGTMSSYIPNTAASADHLYEQIPQTTTWGREFYAVPLSLRTKDTYRVLAAEDGTVVTIGATNTKKTLGKGKYYEFELSSSQACKISSTKKVLVAQYCRTQTADSSTGVGDPFMTIVSPITQSIYDVTFTAYESTLIQNIFYVNIATLTSETGLITLDGNSIGGKFTPFSGTKYSYAQIAVTKGNHRLKTTSTNAKGGFLASVYGFGEKTESYGYGVGFSLNLQLDIGSGTGAESGVLTICEGSSVELDAGSFFNEYKWSTGETSSAIQGSKPGTYCVVAKTALGCTASDCLTIKNYRPEINLGPDQTVCLPGEKTLAANSGYKSYSWQDGSTNQTFTVEKTGDYSVTITDLAGCQNTDVTHVEVILPVLNIQPNYLIATIDHPEISFDNQTEGSVIFSWNFGDGTTSTEASPTHRYSETGTYNVVLTAKAAGIEDCTNTWTCTVKIMPSTFSIPNAFRPASEIILNKVFQPSIVGVDAQKYNFQVYNRIGAVIFKTSEYETGWDGNLPDSHPADQGVYVWVVEYNDIQGYHHTQKGSVMLVR